MLSDLRTLKMFSVMRKLNWQFWFTGSGVTKYRQRQYQNTSIFGHLTLFIISNVHWFDENIFSEYLRQLYLILVRFV